MITAGILLAGGQSSRFGSPKAFASMQGGYFYERCYQILAELCDHVVIVTLAELRQLFPPHLHVITDLDEVKGNGPLAGIYSAMRTVQADRYVVLPCDMPFLTSEGLEKMLSKTSQYNVYAIQLEDQYHPLVSCWTAQMLSPIEEALKQGQYSVMKLLRNLSEEIVWLKGEELFDDALYRLQNINRPEQMKEVK